MVAIGAGIASMGITLGAGQAMGDPLADHLEHQGVQPKRGSHEKLHARV